MKVVITNEEVKFLANMICVADQPMLAAHTDLNKGWVDWVVAPIAQHAIVPKEAKTILTVVGILADYGIPINAMIKVLLKEFVANYQNDYGDATIA